MIQVLEALKNEKVSKLLFLFLISSLFFYMADVFICLIKTNYLCERESCVFFVI